MNPQFNVFKYRLPHIKNSIFGRLPTDKGRPAFASPEGDLF